MQAYVIHKQYIKMQNNPQVIIIFLELKLIKAPYGVEQEDTFCQRRSLDVLVFGEKQVEEAKGALHISISNILNTTSWFF